MINYAYFCISIVGLLRVKQCLRAVAFFVMITVRPSRYKAKVQASLLRSNSLKLVQGYSGTGTQGTASV